MKTENILIANLKCAGCASTIEKELRKIPGVSSLHVDVENDCVNVIHENVDRALLTERLYSLGYPEATEKNGLILQLKSYASCVIGRVNSLVARDLEKNPEGAWIGDNHGSV